VFLHLANSAKENPKDPTTAAAKAIKLEQGSSDRQRAAAASKNASSIPPSSSGREFKLHPTYPACRLPPAA